MSKRVLVGTLKITYLERKYEGLREVTGVKKSDFEALQAALVHHHPLRKFSHRLKTGEIFQTIDLSEWGTKYDPIFELPHHFVQRKIFGRRLVPTGVISIDLRVIGSIELTNLRILRIQ